MSVSSLHQSTREFFDLGLQLRSPFQLQLDALPDDLSQRHLSYKKFKLDFLTKLPEVE